MKQTHPFFVDGNFHRFFFTLLHTGTDNSVGNIRQFLPRDKEKESIKIGDFETL